MAGARELLNRGARVLGDLELISEARASRALDEELTHSGADTSGPPPGFNLETEQSEESLLNRHLRALEDWVTRAEFDRDRHKFRAPSRAPETPTQWSDRVLRQYEGEHDLKVAKLEGVSRAYIRKVRQRAGRDPLHGRPSEARAGAPQSAR